MQAVRLMNQLPDDFPERLEVERAVRDAFKNISGGPWEVTLRRGLELAGSDSVAVELRKAERCVAFASVHPRDTARQIADRLKLFNLSR